MSQGKDAIFFDDKLQAECDIEDYIVHVGALPVGAYVRYSDGRWVRMEERNFISKILEKNVPAHYRVLALLL